MESNSIRLTAPEISSLWTQYLFETMSICFFKYALEHIEDKDIKEIYSTGLQLSEQHVLQIKTFFEGEKYPIPQGFSEDDVNVKAPRLFQDTFYLYYIYIMTLQGLTGYSLSVGTSIRADLRKYYIACNTETMSYYDTIMDTLLSKGLFSRPPVLSPPKKIDFVKHKSFLTGWFGERRPLTGMEIGDITFNMNKMNLHVALKLAYSQVCASNKIRKYIKQGMETSNKQIETFISLFFEEKLNSPITWQSLVTDSSDSPFSDKFMMYQVQLSTQVAIAFYGAALSVTSRRDLALQYGIFTAELTKYGEEGVNIMIENGWLEEPPRASDRRSLSAGKMINNN
ncbi:DUF3231 family protein [Neobacillus sp. D3-1R]|uniref:DUF3231 family protein n=1 Tax=Neobacillus sp. D3-1R TaxID=3445778 RepID=UPI003F9F258F